MYVWLEPRWLARWMRPGGRGARVMWLISLPVAGVLIGVAWAAFTGPGAHGSIPFLAVWTVAALAIVGLNFRTMYLGRGRRAEAMRRALDAQHGS